MEKRAHKNIIRSLLRNMTSEILQEISKHLEPEMRIIESRASEIQSETQQCSSQNTAEVPRGCEIQENEISDPNINQPESSNIRINHEKQTSDAECLIRAQSIVYDPLEDLSVNFHSILDKEYFSDVNIKCGTDILKAHKIILCARSPVFEAMFTNPMQESEDGHVNIEDIECHVLRDFLDFLYSGQLKEITLSKACDLLYAAEKYQIRTLKQLCVDYLRFNLSVENAFQVLECANLYDMQLKSHTLKYISDKFSIIETTEEWKAIQFKCPSLALEVYSTIIKDLKEKK